MTTALRSALALSLFAAAISASAYDLATDFSIANGNPNGVWRYGTRDASGAFTLDTDHGTVTGFDYWGPSGVSVFKNRNAGNAYGIEPGQISLDADTGSPMARFTAPAAGTYSLSLIMGGTQATDSFGGGNARVAFSHLVVNGVENTAYTDANNVRTWTISSLALAAGGTVDAYVQGSSAFGNTQTKFTINPVPEPSALAALGLGAVALLKRRKRA